MGPRFAGTTQGNSMNFEEHAAKSLILAPAGIAVPRGMLCTSAAEAAKAAARSALAWSRRRCRPANAARPAASSSPTRRKRPSRWPGKSSACASATTPSSGCWSRSRPRSRANSTPRCCTTPQARKPLILFSTEGGMDIEEIAAEKPQAIRRLLVDIDGAPSRRRHRRHAGRPRSRRRASADRRHPRRALRRLSRARRRTAGDQSAGAA